tara:strand:+ start:1621 stop:1893 length:273 start_codon:yes stop_codon:yes gene_type:complete
MKLRETSEIKSTPANKMTEHGLLQRAFSLLPHITSIEDGADLINLTHNGTSLMEQYIDELEDNDFRIFCRFVCDTWKHCKFEADVIIRNN